MAKVEVKEGAKTTFKAEQVFNGTWGEVWLDGAYLAEATACKAEISYKNSGLANRESGGRTEDHRIGTKRRNKTASYQ